MALNKENLIQLAKTVARANPSAPVSYSFNGENFSYEALNETLRQELNNYCGTYNSYRDNKNLIFSVIEETIDEILPKKVQYAYEQFAETKQFAQGDKPIFRRKRDVRSRAKQFITRVGLAGHYEVFKLGPSEAESFEVPTSAVGGAAWIGFEEFLDGRVDFAQVVDIVMEGMDELIMKEVGHVLAASVNQLPPANIAVVNGFDEKEFDRLLVIASQYGEPTIYATYQFAVKMVPSEGWRYSEDMKNQLWETGHLATYKGRNVVILPNGLEDETNTRLVIDPGYCFIIPSGADSKPVKIALEGDTHVREVEREDWSREMQVYKKVGVVAMLGNNVCAYADTSLLGQKDLSKAIWDSSAYVSEVQKYHTGD